MDTLLQFLGRLHPVLLHAPIGLVIGLVALEALAAARRRPLSPEARSGLAWLAALSAGATIATGLLLEREGENAAAAVQLHKWFSIGAGAALVLAAIAQTRSWLPGAYRALLALGAVALIPAGHFGASMTHGPDFLTEPFTREQDDGPMIDPPAMDVADPGSTAPGGTTYAAVARPFFERYCHRCHGETRQRGGLALHTPEAILFGGDSGAALIPGDPASSEVIRRLRLPVDHDDHMPPAERRQPVEREIAALEAWIAAGAVFDAPDGVAARDGASAPDDGSEPGDGGVAGARPDPNAGAEGGHGENALPPPDPAALAALRDRLVHVAPIAQDDPLLSVSFGAIGAEADDALVTSLLAPLGAHIGELSLARTRVGDATLPTVAAMRSLRRLDLSGTGVTDAGLEALRGHRALEELVITRLSLTDASAGVLESMPVLRRVYVWRSGLSEAAVAGLRGARPGLLVDAGDRLQTGAVEAEESVTFTSDAPPVDAPPESPPSEQPTDQPAQQPPEPAESDADGG